MQENCIKIDKNIKLSIYKYLLFFYTETKERSGLYADKIHCIYCT